MYRVALIRQAGGLNKVKPRLSQALYRMVSPSLGLFNRDTRSEWVRLRTLILLRWLAIGGQLTAITVADRAFVMQLPNG